MSRRRNDKPMGIQVFAFLDPLICTTGALVILLYAFMHSSRTQAIKVAETKAQAAVAAQQSEVEDIEWRINHLRAARDKTASQLADERLRLSHVEDHERRLQQKLEQLKAAAADLERASTNKLGANEKAESDLAALKQEIDQLRDSVEAARGKGPTNKVSYSIMPYDGRSGTHRRPVYIECRENRIILQPEGIELTPTDFVGEFGPGNPLAAAVRAQREFLARRAAGGGPAEEPYPLMLVRPDGVATYYAARSALESWGSDFGYELIGADWDLKLPEADPQLAELTRQVVAEARVRFREQVLASPQVARRQSRGVYRAKPGGGGFARQPGTGDGPHGSGLGAWDGSGGGRGDGGRAPSRSPGGFGEPGQGSGGDERMAWGAPGGASELADPYADGAPGGDGLTRANGSSGAGQAGSGQPEIDRYGSDRYGTGRYGTGQARNGSGQPGEGTPGSESGGVSPGAMAQSGTPGSGASQARPGGSPGGSQAEGHVGAPAGGSPASGQQGSSAQHAGRHTPDSSAGEAPQARTETVAEYGPNLRPQYGDSAQRTQVGDSQATVTVSPKMKNRNRNWALPESTMDAVAASRPILVLCYADRLVLVGESRTQRAREILLPEQTHEAMDELVSAVWDHMKSWGHAGRGMYWKPTLVLEVQPGAAERYQEIEGLLANSGLDVRQRKTASVARPDSGRVPR